MFKSLTLLATFVAFTATQAFASNETCYQLSVDGQSWSRTPEMLCVDEVDSAATVTLKSGLSFASAQVAEFKLSLLERARCMDCNADVYGLENPSNSVFNELKIRFEGKRTFGAGAVQEAGTVSIGDNTFHYRSF